MNRILRQIPALSIIIVFQSFSSHFALVAYADPTMELAHEAKAKIIEELPTFRLNQDDFQVPRGWPPPLSIIAVERFFKHPLNVTTQSTEWANQIEQASGISELYKTGFEILMGTKPIRSSATKTKPIPPIPKSVPPELQSVLQEFYLAIQEAQPLLNKSVDSLSEKGRDEFLGLYEWPDEKTGLARLEISSRNLKKKYDRMKDFDQKSLLLAGRAIFSTIDKNLSRIQKLSDNDKQINLKWKTPLGVFLIKDQSDQTINNQDLTDVVFYLNLGGNNTYEAPIGAALENQIRIAIDLGENISIRSKTFSPNAGAGIFGIGVLALPNPQGNKIIDIFSYGQGCGIGGVGALLVKGQATIHGVRNVQGVGIFGMGILQAREGHESSYLAERNGQGLGMTSGVGVFSHAGHKASIKGGLVLPDPREPMGSISLVQGVGFGRRAYTGGGVGIAVVNGDKNSVIGSYFAQGCGYWHGFGLFRYRGHGGTMQARRYDQGSGVHFAFGHFQLFGNNNRVLNWGVGPSYGWDFSLGSALIHGSNNEFQATWGTGMASIGSLAYSYIKGDNNKMLLPSFGSGRFYRGRLAYSAQILEGTGNQIQHSIFKKPTLTQGRQLSNPWGVFKYNEITFVPDLKLEKPKDQRISQEKSVPRESISLPLLLTDSYDRDTKTKIADWIDITSAFGHDKETPKKALKHLLSLSEDQIFLVIENLEPAAVDQLIRLNVVIPAYGDRAAQEIMDKFDDQTLQKKLILMKFLGFSRPSLAGPYLFNLIRTNKTDKDSSQLKIAATSAMSALLNKDEGQDPGLNAVLLSIQKFLNSPKKERKNLEELFVRLRLWNIFSVVSICLDGKKEERLKIFEVIPEDVTNKIDETAAKLLVELLEDDLSEAKKRTDKAILTLTEMENNFRPALVQMLKSTQTHVQLSAIQSIGQVGHADDIKHLESFMLNKSGRIREQIAIALGRMAAPAYPLLENKLKNGTKIERGLVLASIPHAVIPESINLLKIGIQDTDPDIRLATIGAAMNLPPVLSKKTKKIHKFIRKKARKDSDPSVRNGTFFLQK